MAAAAGLSVLPTCAHVNGAGLLWRISGGKISSMQTDWAAFEVNGEQHVFPRRPTPTTFVCRRGDRHPERKKEPPRCVWEGMSNPVPVWSLRKSAAIIPSVRSPAGFLLARPGKG
jgi:hypothetical protein